MQPAVRRRSCSATVLSLALVAGAAVAGDVGGRLTIPARGTAVAHLVAIEVSSADAARPDSVTEVDLSDPAVVHIQVEVGDALAKRIVLRAAREDARFAIEQRHRTSMAIGDEGPHMDLLDFEHHVSEWEPLESADGRSFVTREVTSDAFPAVTPEQIVAAATSESARWAEGGYDPGERWIELARQCEAPTDPPCYVGVSEIELRIRVRDGDGWRTIETLAFAIPLGC